MGGSRDRPGGEVLLLDASWTQTTRGGNGELGSPFGSGDADPAHGGIGGGMWFGKRRAEARLNSELCYHMDKLTDEYTAAGMSPEEARLRAQQEFGGVEQIKEDCRDIRGRWPEDLAKDVRYAARG